MIQVENRNIFTWLVIMLISWLLYCGSFGAIFGIYSGLNIARPLGAQIENSEDFSTIQSEADLTDGQRQAIKNLAIERMRETNWWLWWPLLSAFAWCVPSLFLGFMKVVKYNEGLVIFTYLPSLISRSNEWRPPGNFLVECITILISLVVVHFVARGVCKVREKT